MIEDDNHSPDEDASYMEFRVDFDVNENEDGSFDGAMGAINMHIHHVPHGAVIDTLLTLAQEMVSNGMKTGGIDGIDASVVPEQVLHQITAVIARRYLIQRLQKDESQVKSLGVVRIPDDASELFKD